MKSQLQHALPAGRQGFTLTEILIAIGILGVGLAMLAALFPTAIKESSNSTADIVGTMICRNGLAIAKSKLIFGTFTPPATLTNQTATIDSTGIGDSVYPCAAAGTTRGWLLLASMPNTNTKNDYLLVVVSYQKQNSANLVALQQTTGSISTCVDANHTTSFKPTNAADVANLYVPGTPVVDPATGKFAMVVSRDTTNNIVYLDRDVVAFTGGGTVTAPFVVTEQAGGKTLGRSPAMAVLITRTALKQP